MTADLITTMAFQIIGGLTIFLLGMHNMSSGMQAIAGDRLRQLINAVTNNRLMAITVGFLVTAIIQSSSVTSVMTIGFVNAGLMSLTQAIGVILGANVGTTVTGWILVLKVGKYGLPLLGVAGMVFLFSNKDRIRYSAMMLMGIGMVFFGLELMKNGFKPIREIPEFLAMFSKFTPDTITGLLLCASTGALITAIVQSSSASVGIVMSMAITGIINFETAVALVLGMNIGTTITAFLASLGASTNAKRTAYAHTLINCIGALIFIPFFDYYIQALPYLAGANPAAVVIENGKATFPFIIRGIAVAHTFFNIATVVLLIPFVKYFAKVLEKLAPDKDIPEQAHLTKFDVRILDTPIMVIEQSRKEILNMGKSIMEMFDNLRQILVSDTPGKSSTDIIFQREEELDIMQKEISTFLMDTISSKITHSQTLESQSQLRMADEYESISDYITNILKLRLKLNDAGISLSEEKRTEILELHDRVLFHFERINTSIYKRQPEDMNLVYQAGNKITGYYREIRSNHLQRLSQTKTDPLLSVSYMNMLNAYRRIKDHIQNVAEAMDGQK